VLLLTLLFGFWLLNIDNSLSSPAGILGSVSIAIGLLYTFGSFFSNQIKESYKDVIAEYKNTINTLRTSHKDIQKSYQDTLTGQSKERTIGESYKTISETGAGTQDS
jgi:predicted PurR-regulated permease PerM